MKISSFNNVNACNGVFERSRRAKHASPVAPSNVLVIANGAVRFANVYKVRRYRSPPSLTFHCKGPYAPSVVMLGSCGGNKIGPPPFFLCKPLLTHRGARTHPPL